MKIDIPSHFDEDFLYLLAKQPRIQQAHTCHARALRIEELTKRSYLELGLVVLFVDDHRLWEEILDEDGQPYRSWDHWVASTLMVSRAHAYSAKSTIKVLRENNIPLDQAAKIPQCNLQQLKKLSTPVMRDPVVLSKAATMSENEFYEEVRTSYPNEHLEHRSPMKFTPEMSERKIVDAAIDMARMLDEAGTREEALVSVCAFYLDSHRAQWEAMQPKAMAATV